MADIEEGHCVATTKEELEEGGREEEGREGEGKEDRRGIAN